MSRQPERMVHDTLIPGETRGGCFASCQVRPRSEDRRWSGRDSVPERRSEHGLVVAGVGATRSVVTMWPRNRGPASRRCGSTRRASLCNCHKTLSCRNSQRRAATCGVFVFASLFLIATSAWRRTAEVTPRADADKTGEHGDPCSPRSQAACRIFSATNRHSIVLRIVH